MPAAITTSATSASSASRSAARSTTSSCSAAPAPRTRRSASITGPGFGPDGIVDAVEKVVDRYLELRNDASEPFLAAYGRLGPAPFKEALYAAT